MVLNFIPVTSSQLRLIPKGLIWLINLTAVSLNVLEHQHDRHDGHLKRFALVPTSNRNCQRSDRSETGLGLQSGAINQVDYFRCASILLDHAVRLFICLIVTPHAQRAIPPSSYLTAEIVYLLLKVLPRWCVCHQKLLFSFLHSRGSFFRLPTREWTV